MIGIRSTNLIRFTARLLKTPVVSNFYELIVNILEGLCKLFAGFNYEWFVQFYRNFLKFIDASVDYILNLHHLQHFSLYNFKADPSDLLKTL